MKIMFLCTDNFTRSVTAELCLRHYLKARDRQDIDCASSGTHANSDVSGLFKDHFERMTELGIDISPFRRLQFEASFLREYDVVVAMAAEHRSHVRGKFNATIPLFDEIYKGEDTSVDIKGVDPKRVREALRGVVDYIDGAIPDFLKSVARFGQ